jgi:hypothetical protein
LKIGHLILCALNHFVLVALGAPRERKHQNRDHRYSQAPTQMPTLRFKCASVTLAPASDQYSRPARFRPRLVVWKFCIVQTVFAALHAWGIAGIELSQTLRGKEAKAA